MQTLLLEGGPTLATAFLAAGLVDKLIVFVAPVLAGGGPHLLGELAAPQDLSHFTVEQVGGDAMLTGYVREP